MIQKKPAADLIRGGVVSRLREACLSSFRPSLDASAGEGRFEKTMLKKAKAKP